MVRKRTNLTRPAAARSHANRRTILARQLTQGVVDPQNTINVDIHTDLIHDHGKVNVLLSRQVGNLNGLRLIVGIHHDIQGIAGAIQLHTGALNLAIRRTLVKQLPGFAIAVHPIIHGEPASLREDQPLLLIVRNRNLAFLGCRRSSIL